MQGNIVESQKLGWFSKYLNTGGGNLIEFFQYFYFKKRFLYPQWLLLQHVQKLQTVFHHSSSTAAALNDSRFNIPPLKYDPRSICCGPFSFPGCYQSQLWGGVSSRLFVYALSFFQACRLSSRYNIRSRVCETHIRTSLSEVYALKTCINVLVISWILCMMLRCNYCGDTR